MDHLKSIQLSFRCPVKFNELTPCAGGLYCSGCHKTVRDLRGKTEEQVLQQFAKDNYKMCGLFEADRIHIATPLANGANGFRRRCWVWV